MGALWIMKGLKASELNGTTVEMLKCGGYSITERLLRIFNRRTVR